MKKLIYILYFLVLFACKTQYVAVPVETIKTNKEFVDRWHKDSIYVRDSIIIYKESDTVFIEKYKYLFRNKQIKDSIYIHDSIIVEIPFPVKVIKEVNRLRNWQILLMCFGGVFIGYIGYYFWRRFG